MRPSPLEAREGPVVEGYPDRLSYRPGDAVSLAVRTTTAAFDVEIARVGATRDVVCQRGGLPGTWHETPEDASSAGCNWPESFRFEIPGHLRSGYYEVVLRALDRSSGRLAEHVAFFAVRPDRRPELRPGRREEGQRRLLLVLATNTYNAYNDWGGPSLYTGEVRASFRRPFAPGFLRKPEPHVRYPNVPAMDDPEHEHFREWADLHGLARWSGSAGWHNWERVFLAWAEREGYDVDVAVNADFEYHPEVLAGQRCVVSVGHDEYWSWAMRDALEGFIGEGGNAAFFSGNAVCWQVRYEDEGATMVAYKSRYRDDPAYVSDPRRTTTLWSSAVVGRPENSLTGVSFSRGGYVRMGRAVPRASGGYSAWRPGHWAFSGTDLRYGDVFGTADTVVAYEVDGCELQLALDDGLPVATGRDGTPQDFTVLASAPARLWSRDELPSRYRSDEVGDLEMTAEAVFGDASPAHVARLAHNHAVMGTYTRGGTVFTAGTTDWSYGLAGRDPDVCKITRNVLDRLCAPQAPVEKA